MTTGAPPVSIVIPAYGRDDLTRQCLESLVASGVSGADVPDAEILVADNAASLDPQGGRRIADCGRALFGARFRYLPQTENRNFSGACNAGAREATGRLLCFLNNDTTQEPGWLSALAAALRDGPDLDAVSPLLLYPSSDDDFGPTIQHLGVVVRPDMRLRHIYEHFPADHRVARRRRFSILSAAALCMERGLFEAVGGFDEAFRNGFEDVELCARLRARRPGSRPGLACEPKGVVFHLCGQSRGRHPNEADEEHNNAVLAQRRVYEILGPDEHAALREDGYELRLTPWLDWQPCLPPREAGRLRRACAAAGDKEMIPALDEALHAEPFWTEGWDLRIQRESEPGRALALALRAEHFDAGPAPLRHIVRLAATLGRNDLAAQAESALARYATRPDAARLRALRADLRRRVPELAPEADRLLAAMP